MSGPTQPAPRPLPNPGPPPAPAGETTQPGPGPKPEGPTGPTPTGPGRLPTLAQNVDNATKILNAAIFFLGRDWDQATGPSDQDDPWGPEAVDISLGCAVADIRSALHELAAIPTMSSARWDTTSASLPGGPFNHPVRRPDEGLTPGLDAGVVGAREGSDAAHARADAGSSHLTRTSPRVSGGRTPGLVDSSAPTDGSRAAAPGREAGVDPDPIASGSRAAVPASAGSVSEVAQQATGKAHRTGGDGVGPNTDPRPARIGSDAPEMTGVPRFPDEQLSVRPGVGFTVPEAKAFDIRQTISDAYAKQRRMRRR